MGTKEDFGIKSDKSFFIFLSFSDQFQLKGNLDFHTALIIYLFRRQSSMASRSR